MPGLRSHSPYGFILVLCMAPAAFSKNQTCANLTALSMIEPACLQPAPCVSGGSETVENGLRNIDFSISVLLELAEPSNSQCLAFANSSVGVTFQLNLGEISEAVDEDDDDKTHMCADKPQFLCQKRNEDGQWESVGCVVNVEAMPETKASVLTRTCTCAVGGGGILREQRVRLAVVRDLDQVVALCHAESLDYVAIAVYFFLISLTLIQLIRIACFVKIQLKLNKGAKRVGWVTLLYQHAGILVCCIFRLIFLINKAVLDLPVSLMLSFAASWISMLLYSSIFISWIDIGASSQHENSLSALRLPLKAILGFSAIVAFTSPIVVFAIGKGSDGDHEKQHSVVHVFVALLAIGSCCESVLSVLVGCRMSWLVKKVEEAPIKGVGAFDSFYHAKAAKEALTKNVSKKETPLHKQLLVISYSLALCLLLQGVSFVVAVTQGVLDEEESLQSVDFLFYLLDACGLSIILVLWHKSINRLGKNLASNFASRTNTNAGEIDLDNIEV